MSHHHKTITVSPRLSSDLLQTPSMSNRHSHLLSFLLLLLLLLLPPPLSGGPCANRRIHILPLPSSFNSDLLSLPNSSFPLSDSPSFSPYLPNHSLGPRTHPLSHSWFRTDPRLLEPLFHHRLSTSYPCLSPSPLNSTAIFLPYYASLDALPFLFNSSNFNTSVSHGLPLYEYLVRNHAEILNQHHGHNLFLVLSGVAWDFNQDPRSDPVSWGTSFLRLEQFMNFTILTQESRPWPWQEHAIPHPTSFHPPSLTHLSNWISRAARSKRETLMLFAGGGTALPPSPTSRPNIRSSIIAQCTNRTDLCTLVDCSAGTCTHDPIKYMLPMLKSKFCLQPPGDTPTRRSTFDSIIAGCIPVFFEEISAKRQYGWHLAKSKYDEFSVFIPKEDVVFGGESIARVLGTFSEERVRRMREKVLEVLPRVLYKRHGFSEDLRGVKDAFDLAIDGVLRRIRRRVKAFEDGDFDRIYLLDDDDEEEDF
ncbi:hypothetical protein LUZ60_008538 [Juncus effusus]|nr:hypothetical protein LUZ60_008538 [Juncus effusus]